VRLWNLPPTGVTTAPESPISEVDTKAGSIVALHALPGQQRSLLAAHENGKLSICYPGGSKKKKVEVWEASKDPIEASALGAQMGSDEAVVAIGGRERELQVWDVITKKALWLAKNLPDSHLELRQPVWVAAIHFFPESVRKLATATGHREVRIYDIKAQRRPVHNWKVGDRKFTSVCVYDENLIIAGDTVGQATIFDIRAGRVREKLKGCAGSITSIVRHPTEQAVVITSRDRFTRVFSVEGKANTNKMKAKVYCKQALTCSLFSCELPIKEIKAPEAGAETSGNSDMAIDAGEYEDDDDEEDISGNEIEDGGDEEDDDGEGNSDDEEEDAEEDGEEDEEDDDDISGDESEEPAPTLVKKGSKKRAAPSQQAKVSKSKIARK